MSEWKVELPGDWVTELEDCFLQGAIIDDTETRLLNEEVFDRLNGLKMDVFSNEHPPPHFRVCFQEECNNFKISDCSPMNGDALKSYFRNIRKWHKSHKEKLIEFWNEKRPSDCPVGKYVEET